MVQRINIGKSSLPKSMQPSIPPIGRRLSFSTSQVDLTHNDDYHYCIEVKTIVVMLNDIHYCHYIIIIVC